MAIYAEKNDKYLSNLQNKSFESLIHMLFFYDHLKEKAEQLITEGKINANTAFEFCWKQIYRLKQKKQKTKKE